jgi:hypothetical protein
MDIYQRAERNGVELETTCVDISEKKYDLLFKNALRADKKRVTAIAVQAGIIDKSEARLWNPYPCHKTRTHLIYTHSCIDYFLRVL